MRMLERPRLADQATDCREDGCKAADNCARILATRKARRAALLLRELEYDLIAVGCPVGNALLEATATWCEQIKP